MWQQETGTGNLQVTVVSIRPAKPPEAEILRRPPQFYFEMSQRIGERVCEIFVTFFRSFNFTKSLDFTGASIEDLSNM